MAKMMLTVAEMDTPYGTVTAIGESEDLALKALRDGWNKYRKDCGHETRSFKETSEDNVGFHEVPLNGCWMDWLPM